jgi:hypothetical protein
MTLRLTRVLALAKPPSMSRGRVCDMREDKVGLMRTRASEDWWMVTPWCDE